MHPRRHLRVRKDDEGSVDHQSIVTQSFERCDLRTASHWHKWKLFGLTQHHVAAFISSGHGLLQAMLSSPAILQVLPRVKAGLPDVQMVVLANSG